MSKLSLESALTDFRRLDLLALEDTPVHRLDARVKVLTTLVFVTTVMSYGRYEFSSLFPFLLFPLSMVILGNIPVGYLFKRIILVIPFAVMVGMFNPLLDRQPLLWLGPLAVSGGWVSCASIVLRALLTAGAALILVSVTGFPAICHSLNRMGVPQGFTTQLLFLHRYLFVLVEEARQVSRARQLRSFGRKGLGIIHSGPVLGNLLLRTWERAERIHLAMLARGFNGDFPTRKEARLKGRDLLFLAGWSSFFTILRSWNIPRILGHLVTGT